MIEKFDKQKNKISNIYQMSDKEINKMEATTKFRSELFNSEYRKNLLNSLESISMIIDGENIYFKRGNKV